MSDYYDLSDDERHDPRDPDDEPTVAEIYQSVRDENRRRAEQRKKVEHLSRKVTR